MVICCKENTNKPINDINGDKLYMEGVELIQKNDIQAYLKFQQAIDYYLKSNDSSNISKSLICQAISQKNLGDAAGAEATLVEALKLMKDNDESLYSVYGTLADLKLNQNEYSKAIIWYDKALSEKISSTETIANILNNKSVAEFKSNKYSNALNLLQSINLSQIKNENLINRIKENIEYTKWLRNNNYDAQKNIERIIERKLQNDDLWGLNSSYSHLAEINRKTNPEKSLFYANEMLKTAKKIKSPEDRLEAIEKILLVDKSSNYNTYFEQYKNLSDSIQKNRNNYKEQFAYIRYDSEKKNTENQKLKAEDAENQNRILIRNIALLSSLLIITAGIFWYKRRKNILQLEKESEIKNTQIKYSKKVHDVVANGLYQAMVEVQNNEEIEKEHLLDKLENLYEKSRDISHEKYAETEQNFSEKLSNMLSSYSSDETRVLIIGNNENLWQSLSQKKRKELFIVLQELMVNMKKHSNATFVALKFEKTEKNILIKYTDNGIGINNLEKKSGSGISNTKNRIAIINGLINFEQNPNGGLIVNINIPISNV